VSVDEVFRLVPRTVVDRDAVVLATGEVSGQIRTHNRETDDTDVGLRHSHSVREIQRENAWKSIPSLSDRLNPNFGEGFTDP
jgi:hypothetical protein